MTTLKEWLRGYLRASWHIKASQVVSGADRNPQELALLSGVCQH